MQHMATQPINQTEICKAIADNLEGWKLPYESGDRDGLFFIPNDYASYIKGGKAIWLSFATHPKPRLCLSGCWPYTASGTQITPRDIWIDNVQQNYPSINVDPTRNPVTLAKDIARRFLPVYNLAYEQCNAKAAEYDESDNRQLANVQFIADVYGIPITAWERNNHSVSLNGDGYYGQFKVLAGDDIRLEINCDVALAKILASAIRDYRKAV